MVYEKIKTLTRKPGGNRDIAVKDRSGKLLQDPMEVRTRWKEYIEELYKGVDNSHDYKEEEPQSEDVMGPDFLKDKILAAIGEIKNNKAEGIDNIPIEMLKTFGEKAMKELVQLCKEIYNTGVWPEDFLQTVMVPLKKKPNAMTCEDHRTISLLTHALKIVLRVLTKRLQSRAERDNCIGEDQYGFRKGKGTRDAIGTLRVMTERSLQHGQNIDVCFCRLRKGFRSIELEDTHECTEKNTSGLERKETQRELIHGPDSKNKNRRGMFGTGSDRQRSTTRMPAFANTLPHLHRRNNERSNRRDDGGHKGGRTTDECTKICRRPGNDSSQPCRRACR